MPTTVNEVIARPARTGGQSVVAFAIVEFIDSFISDLSEKQYGAAVGLLVIILAGLQIIVERGIGKSFMRHDEPPAQEVPLVGEAAPVDEEELLPPEPGVVADPDLGVPGPMIDPPVDDHLAVEPVEVNDPDERL